MGSLASPWSGHAGMRQPDFAHCAQWRAGSQARDFDLLIRRADLSLINQELTEMAKTSINGEHASAGGLTPRRSRSPWRGKSPRGTRGCTPPCSWDKGFSLAGGTLLDSGLASLEGLWLEAALPNLILSRTGRGNTWTMRPAQVLLISRGARTPRRKAPLAGPDRADSCGWRKRKSRSRRALARLRRHPAHRRPGGAHAHPAHA